MDHVDLLWRFFGGKHNAFAEQQQDGRYIKHDQEISLELLQKHVDGSVTVAVYPVVEGSNRCQWGVIDFDSKSPQCRERLIWIKKHLEHIGLSPLMEPSGLKGYHLWILIKEWVPAGKVQRLLQWAVKKAEEEFGKPDYMVEINPKQTSGTGYGSPVKLPWGTHRKSGNKTYFIQDDFKAILPNLGVDAVECLPSINEAALDEIISEWLPYEEENPAMRGGRLQPMSDAFNIIAATKLEQNCAFIRHCRENAKTLGEPQWWSMVCQFAVFGDPGDKKIHELSNPYPQYSEHETQQKIENARQKEDIGPHTCEYIRRDLGFGCPEGCIAKRLEVASPAGMARKLAAQEQIQYRTASVDITASKAGKQWIFVNCRQLALEIMRDHVFKTFSDNEEILVYCDGIYKGKGEAMIKKEVESRLGDFNTIHRTKEVIHHILTSTYIERDAFNVDKDLINLKNGILDLATTELIPHSPEFLSTVQIPVEYDPHADCPAIRKFMAEILPLESILVVEEFAGYCLYREYPIHRAIMLIGDGAMGCGTVIYVIFQPRLNIITQNVTYVVTGEVAEEIAL